MVNRLTASTPRQGSRSPRLAQDNLQSLVALMALLVLGLLALFGPTGLFAWSENSQLLEQRRTELAALSVQRDSLKNRVALLDPDNADRDLAGELMRDRLNVARPDELVIPIN